MKKFLYWAPRVLSIVMVCFVSVFALDVFEEGKTAGEIALALLIHLLPSIAAVILIIVAWKKEQIGGWLFLGLAVVFLFIGGFELVAVLIISLPFALTGGMFLMHYQKYVKQPKDSMAKPVAG
ncbi:MAG: hypothetical protein WC505_01365 [Patescibacteria group bacterium]